MSDLRKKIIRLAYQRPHLRGDLLPLIQKTANLSKKANEELYVVIGNWGRGRQTLWPTKDDAQVYTKSKAERVLREAKSRSKRMGDTLVNWHMKPLSEADQYVMGDASYALQRLTDDLYRWD